MLQNDFKPLLASMSQEMFEQMRLAVVLELEEKDKSLYQESGRHHDEIKSGR